MLRISVLFSLAVSMFACPAAAPVDTPPPSAPSDETPATAMPESLRCKRADDCTPEPNCYWSTPKCVAAASVVGTAECGTDADPKAAAAPTVTCGCQGGQCVPLSGP